jgi:phenylacetate-CoA ligase
MLRKLLFLARMRKQEYLSPKKIEQLQLRKLQEIISYAYENVPFYKKKFDHAKVKPEDIKTLKDIKKIPITTKKELQKATVSERFAKGYSEKNTAHYTTGGSTGINLDIYCDYRCEEMRKVSIIRTYLANGWRPNFKIAMLQNEPLEKKSIKTPSIVRKIHIPYQWTLERQTKFLKTIKPDALEGFPNRISLIARQVTKNNTSGINPKYIITNSETTTQIARDNIKKAFKIEASNVYDCWEFGNIAWECKEHQGLHINADLMHVEILKNNKDATTGEVIITEFENKGAPLIRYSLGDIGTATKKRCGCKRTLPMLKEVQGRISDYVIMTDGRKINSTTFQLIIRSHKGMWEHQLIQKRIGELEVNLVVDKNFTTKEAISIKSKLKAIGLKKVTINKVKSIPKTAAGKHRSFISQIKEK